MPTYIVLLRMTKQGIEHIKEGPARLDTAKQTIQAMGAALKAYYLTMGQYDAVAILEAPDDETVARIALTQGSRGATRSETLRAFPEEDYRKIIAALP